MSNSDLACLQEVDTWIFDLDNTLYPPTVGLVGQMNARIRQYLRRIFGFDEPAAYRMQAELSREHGTTLRGLMVTRGVDPEEYLEFEHDIDYSALSPDPRLAKALATLPGRKFVLTNAISTHADIVIERLGFAGIFDGVFDLRAADLFPKPDPETYRLFIERYEVDPLRATMIDDLEHNLLVPHRMGMRTLWLKPGSDLTSALEDFGGSPRVGLEEVPHVGGADAGLRVG